jgi:hypothetical protein
LLTTHRLLAAEHAELHALPRHRGAHLDRVPEQDLGGGERLLRQHRGRAGLDDTGLLPRDLLQRVAEQPGVIDRDRGDDRHHAVGDVGAVEPAAHADLEHDHVDRRVGEDREGHPGQHLEEGHRGRVPFVHQPHVREDLLVRRYEPLGVNRRAVDTDPLPDRHQVRAGEPAGPQAAAAQQRIDHPGRRRLAVGTRHVDDGARALRIAEQPDELGHPV